MSQNNPTTQRRVPVPQGSSSRGTPQGGESVDDVNRKSHRRKRPANKSAITNSEPGGSLGVDVGRDIASARNAKPISKVNAKEVVKQHISNLPARSSGLSNKPANGRHVIRPQAAIPLTSQLPTFTLPSDFDSNFANSQVLELLKAAPSVFPDHDGPFLTAYAQTLIDRDPREAIYPPILENADSFTSSCIESWRNSLPTKEVRETISRIIWNVNEVIAARWPRMNFVVEPFGSVSWRGQTGGQGDLDLVMRDYARPLGYSEDYWGQGGASNMKLPSVYNTNVVARALRDSGFVEVEPIKWASTPITKFKDPYSGYEIDLNINDLGGLYNSAMINAYCRLSPYQLRPLIHIVKLWSKARDLNNPSGRNGERSLSSYCWALMAIAYMQVKHGLPNLQDEQLVGRADRQDVDIWVGWGRSKGIPAHVSFADRLTSEDISHLHLSTKRWSDREIVHTDETIGNIVKGFFDFYAELVQEPRVDMSGTSFKSHAITVWKGGMMKRGLPWDLRYDSRLEEFKREKKLPASAQQVEQASIATTKLRSEPVEGFAQPQEWSGADLVVQDPFLHDKNCASGMNHRTFQRLQTEFARARTILTDGLPLDTLLEICSQSGHVTKAERRAAERKSHKAKQQTDRQMATTTKQQAESIGQSDPKSEAEHGVTSELPTKIPDATSKDSGAGNQGDLGAKLGLAMAGLAVVSTRMDTDTTQEDEAPITESHLAEAHAREGIAPSSVKMPDSLGSVDTIYSADSIEFSPVDSEIFVCGTYQIEKIEAEIPKNESDKSDEGESEAPAIKRRGRALVYRVQNGGQDFQEIQRLEGPAILDMKWSPCNAPGGNRLAIANAEGQIILHHWDKEAQRLHDPETVEVDESSVLCLSLDWSNQLDPAASTSIISSLSNGNLAHLVTDTDGTMVVDHSWKAHDYEPWITSWDLWQSNTVWSGGDDLKLKRWDVRVPMMPTFINKSFEGGVTTIASNPHVEHLLAVGSYDENLRVFDARNAKTPLETIPVGGGIWRTKWHPSAERKGDVLLACMHGGFKIVRLTEPGNWLSSNQTETVRTWAETTSFDKHGSIAYGVDWQRRTPRGSMTDGSSLVASCSFYDHLLHLWRG